MEISMSSETFFVANHSVAASHIAALAGTSFVTEDFAISAAGTLATAGVGELCYMDDAKYIDQLKVTRASACLILPRFKALVPVGTFSFVTPHPYAVYAQVLALLYPEAIIPTSNFGTDGISPKANVHALAKIGHDVTIDPGASIGPNACIGDFTCIGSNAVIGPGVTIGRHCYIGANTAIAHAVVGDRVIIHPGASIGQDGFGFTFLEGRHIKIPQVGGVIIQNDVEVGANTTIDRGSMRATFIGEGTKLDNLVQVAHNVTIGAHCVIAAQVGIAGSTTIAEFVAIGGHSGIAPHLTIGRKAQIGGTSGVMCNIPAGERWVGVPASRSRTFFRQYAILKRLAKRS
jgi:UDP-3-O-[3-hydroxymyristoyl] glucosamine N-acyltransferase